MSTWRPEKTPCPLGGEAELERCRPCRFFRGASRHSDAPGWEVCCNWPRSGSYIAPDPTPLPDYVRRAFKE